MCSQSCPSDFPDIGIACSKPQTYSRGAGYSLWDQGKCNNEHSDVGGCEQYGLLYYPKCKTSKQLFKNIYRYIL